MLFSAKRHLWKLWLFSSEDVLYISLFPPVISKPWKHLLGIFFLWNNVFVREALVIQMSYGTWLNSLLFSPETMYLLSPVFFSTIVSIFMAINIFADALYGPQQHSSWQTQSLQFLCAIVGRAEWAASRTALVRGIGNVLVCRMLCPSVLHQNGIYSCFTGVCYKLYSFNTLFGEGIAAFEMEFSRGEGTEYVYVQ